ncbi:MAG: YidC/Oxa1 family membrane protein insertase [Clostridiales bacterium]|nr:YidC/Oxa1 family membrane protein insertase [Clostridiales bacterium]
MFEFFANIFGYLLQFVYHLVNNYGLAIILFTVIIKILLLPLSIKQQRSMKKSAELNEKMKVLQFKYKNDPEKLNQEMMNLYKSENMSPFSGCLTAIIQLLLLLSIFYLVRSPLTYMEKIPTESINNYVQQLKDDGKTISQVYPEIDLIREYQTIKEKNPEDANVEKINIQMNFLGLDLSKIPQQNMTDYTVYIIPVLYILSSFISIRMTTAMQEKQNKANKEKKEQKEVQIDGTTGKELVPQEEENEMDAVMQTNKMMSWMMPIMSISIAFVAPLGLALYWLVSNILMIVERIILDKIIK